MAIIFNKVARKSPKDKSVKYYITPKTIKLMGLRDIARSLWRRTPPCRPRRWSSC